MKIHKFILTLFLLLSLGVDSEAFAQADQADPETIVVPVKIDPGPADALNRGTPRGSIIGFLEACSTFDFEKAAEYLDLRGLPEEVAEVGGKELARQLNHVISRAVWLDDYTLSAEPEGMKGDGLPDYRDELMVVRQLNGENATMWMQRVPRGDGERIWKVSNRSVALIPDLYDDYSYPGPIEKIRGYFPEDASFLGLEAFKWFILLSAAVLAWFPLYLLGRLLTALFTSRDKENYQLVRHLLTGPVVAIVIILILGYFLSELGAGAHAQQIMRAQTLPIVIVVWALWAIINLYRQRKQTKLVARERPGAAKLIRPLTAFLKMLILLFGVLFWLNNLGINITTLLAGLGVGGLAIALALQKPLEDMMGALTIFSQASIRVGDFCKYGEFTGTVEDIGLRSVKIRTLTDTVVSIPNSRIAYVEVENITAREKIRFWPTLRLRYDTTPDQLLAIKNSILDLLKTHERIHDQPVRVRLTDFDEDAILIKLHCFLMTTDFPESLEIAEELNFRILDIIHAVGAGFALPGKSIYMEQTAASQSS